MTARTIITRALRLIKVIAANESGDAADLDTGLTALNDMLGSWSLERNAVLATVIETFNATGALSYTIGPGGDLSTPVPISVPIVEYTVNGLDYSLTEWTEQQYASIGQKSEIGQPVGYWFVKSPTLAKLYFAPAPSTGSFKIHSLKAITAFTGLDTSYDLAPGYQDALVYNLAMNLAGEFEAEAPKTVILKAMNLKRTLKRSNAVVPVLDAGVPLNPYRYGYHE